MKVTSKEANKLLKELEAERNRLLTEQEQASTFLASVGEDVESCRPNFDYEKSKEAIKEVESKIIKLKHAINVFNTNTTVDGYDKTIDEILVYIPQLTQLANRLARMQNRLPKEREGTMYRSNVIDYRYTNYDIDKVKEDYKAVVDELHKCQIALDTTNVNKTFDVKI